MHAALSASKSPFDASQGAVGTHRPLNGQTTEPAEHRCENSQQKRDEDASRSANNICVEETPILTTMPGKMIMSTFLKRNCLSSALFERSSLEDIKNSTAISITITVNVNLPIAKKNIPVQ